MEFINKSLSIRLNTLGNKHPHLSENYTNLGSIYALKGNYEKSLENYQQALLITIKTFGKNHPDVAQSYYYIGKLYRKKNDITQSLYYFQKSILYLVPAFNDSDIYHNPSIISTLSEIGLLNSLAAKADAFKEKYLIESNDFKDMKASLSNYNLASDLIEKIRTGYKTEGSKLLLGEKTHAIYEQAIQTSFHAYEITNERKYLENALFFVEKSKAAVLSQSLHDSRAKKVVGIPDTLLEKEKDLRIDLAFYETEIQKEKLKKENQDSSKIRDFEDRYFHLKRDYEKLIGELDNSYPRYYDMKYNTEVATVSDLQQSLDNQTALLEYFVGDSTIHIFTITKDSFNVTSMAIDSSFFELTESFRSSITSDRKECFVKSAQQLYDILIASIAGNLSGKQSLVIIPHGILYKIPFEALIINKPEDSSEISDKDYNDLEYLVKKFNISYHYSATLYLNSIKNSDRFLVKDSDKLEDFLGFAPVFREEREGNKIVKESLFANQIASIKGLFSNLTRDGEHLNELPFSKDEVQGIINEFKKQNGKTMGYIYDTASEENFKNIVNKYKYVHLATHSYIYEDKPSLSGIFFFQPGDSTSKETEDGILYSGETYNLDLNADLVVLSSCESGFGKFVRGEGLMALTRGFLYSGAKNIMFSLWKVKDKHTSQLMLEFYKQMLKGKSYAEALQAAKLEMLKNNESANPVFWSGFILVGNSHFLSIKDEGFNEKTVLILLLIISFGVIFYLYLRSRQVKTKGADI